MILAREDTSLDSQLSVNAFRAPSHQQNGQDYLEQFKGFLTFGYGG